MASMTFAGRRRPVETDQETAAEQPLPVVITPAGDTLPAQQPEAAAPAAKPKRARRPAGGPQGGEFQGDDPATPEVNEAWQEPEAGGTEA